MSRAIYDGYQNDKKTSWLERAVFWVGVATLLGSVASLGENLFRGLTLINAIIDGWHYLTEPVAAWLSEYVFAWFDIEVSQLDIDKIVVFGFLLRISYRFFVSLLPHIKSFSFSFLSILIWAVVGAIIIVKPERPIIALAQIKDGNYFTLWMLGVFVIASFVYGLMREPRFRALSTLCIGGVIYILLGMLVEINMHADDNLPYIERWLTAWDDIFVEE